MIEAYPKQDPNNPSIFHNKDGSVILDPDPREYKETITLLIKLKEEEELREKYQKVYDDLKNEINEMPRTDKGLKQKI